MQQSSLRPFAAKGMRQTDKIPFKREVDLVVFSHLRWEFVTQRPQHIIGRFAKDRKVLFVEEPIGYDSRCEGRANIVRINQNLTVLQPCINHYNMIDELEPIVLEYMQRLDIKEPNLWFYSAAFHEMTQRIPHRGVIYDCMDELSAFKGASKTLIAQEKALLQKADVVFTGGKSLYEAKQRLSKHVFCYPSSVDQGHFEKALSAATVVPSDIASIQHPIVGYYGVIDERIDLKLLDQIAQLRPDVSFVMIGPVVKINEHELPRRSNLHYLGSKPYNDLPAYLKAFVIAMMPFALNEATEFISPTKTLEYIAALKPVISTPIFDVKRDYSKVLSIVSNAPEFLAAIDHYLHENANDVIKRKQEYACILQAVSWDKTVAAMKQNIEAAIVGVSNRSVFR